MKFKLSDYDYELKVAFFACCLILAYLFVLNKRYTKFSGNYNGIVLDKWTNTPIIIDDLFPNKDK